MKCGAFHSARVWFAAEVAPAIPVCRAAATARGTPVDLSCVAWDGEMAI